VREIRRLIVHHSASSFGDADLIDQWHKERGWQGIGYHYVILNGCRTSSLKYRQDDDGLVEYGLPEAQEGAHVKGHNADSLGICLIGGRITRWQYCALIWLLRQLNGRYAVGIDGVLGHGELDPINKAACPGFDMELLRAALTTAGEPPEEE